MRASTEPTPLESYDEISRRFERLSDWLSHHSAFILERPFTELTVSWELEEQALAKACRNLTWAEIKGIEADPAAWDNEPFSYKELREQSSALSAVPRAPYAKQHVPRPRRIPGRKWEQIVCLSQVLDGQLKSGDRIVDWCGGKGHLGRTLGQTQDSPVLVLERQEHLCAAAQTLAIKQSVELTAQAMDVLSNTVVLDRHDQLVGLHACGQLTDHLLKLAHKHDTRIAAVASCCYHATADGEFHGQSAHAKAATHVPVNRHSLRLVTADEVVARPTLKRRREREHAFRLGLDLLIREATGEDIYFPLPSVPGKLIEQSFKAFCASLAKAHDLPLPASFSPSKAESAGWERSKYARGLGLVRALFRRPLELWLVLDRGLAVLEAGRTVQITEFCDRRVTPRNLLLLSKR
jgi:hypothetical protein